MPLRDVNLLPKLEKRGTDSSLLYILLICILILAYVIFGIIYFSVNSNFKATEIEHKQISEDVKLLEASLSSLETEQMTEFEDAANFVDGHNIYTSFLVIELNDLLPEHSYLVNYDYTTDAVKVTVHTETLTDVATYTSNLMGSKYLMDTKVDQVSTFTQMDHYEQGINEIDVIPRYEVEFILEVDKSRLKGVTEENE